LVRSDADSANHGLMVIRRPPLTSFLAGRSFSLSDFFGAGLVVFGLLMMVYFDVLNACLERQVVAQTSSIGLIPPLTSFLVGRSFSLTGFFGAGLVVFGLLMVLLLIDVVVWVF